MRETRTKSGQDASPATKNTKKNSKEDETVVKTTPRGRGRPRLDRSETPKPNEDTSSKREDSNKSRSMRQSTTPASKDKNSMSETTDAKTSTAKRKRLEVDTPTSKTGTVTKTQEKMGIKKTKLAETPRLKDTHVKNIGAAEQKNFQELQGGGDGKKIGEISGRRRSTASEAAGKMDGQEKSTGGTSDGRGRGRPPGIKRKADDDDAKKDKMMKVDMSSKGGDGRKDEDATLSTPSSEKRGRGRPRKSEVTETKIDNKPTEVEISKSVPVTVDKVKPDLNMASTANSSSPRRSGRGVIPNRRFQDMDIDLPKKKNTPKKATPQKIPAKTVNEGKQEKILNTEETKRNEKYLKKPEPKTPKSSAGIVPSISEAEESNVEKISVSGKLKPSAVIVRDEEVDDVPVTEVGITENKYKKKRIEDDADDEDDKEKGKTSNDDDDDEKEDVSDVKIKKSDLESEESDSANTIWSSSRHAVKCVVRDGRRTTTEVIVYPPKKLTNNSQSASSKKTDSACVNPVKSPASSTPKMESVTTETTQKTQDIPSVTPENTDSVKSAKVPENSIIHVWVSNSESASADLSVESGTQNTIPGKANSTSKILASSDGSSTILKSPSTSTDSGTVSTSDISKLKSVLLEEKGDNLVKARREDGVTDEMVIVDTPVYIPPSTSHPTKPGKIVRPSADRTICVSVSGKSDNSQENIRNVTVKIPSNYSQNHLPSSGSSVRPGIKITSPTKAPQLLVQANQSSSHLVISPNQSSPQVVGSATQSLPQVATNQSTSQVVVSSNQSSSQVVSANQGTSRVAVSSIQTSTQASLMTDQGSQIEPIKSSDTEIPRNGNESGSQTILIEGDAEETVDKLLEDVENLNDEGEKKIVDMKTLREIKVEPRDVTQLVTAETQTPIIQNRYKKVIREIGSNKILDPSKCEKSNAEEVIIVELPAGAQVKREVITQEKTEHPDFVTIDANGLYQCKFCSYNTHKKSNWYKHKNKHFVMRNHQCPHCTYRAATSSNLKRHIAIHSDVRDFHCDICQLNFRQKIHLERHLKYKHQEKTVQCPICPYVCANENPDLKVHIKRRHMPNESVDAFTCEECGLVTVSKKDLRQHMKFHRKGPELKLFCEHCSFVTDCESRLRRHLFIHTKEKPFQCGLCEYRGSQKEHVLRHMKSQHNIEIERERGPRKNNQSFSSDSTQEVVISNSNEKADYSSEEKIFACNHCTMKFSKLINLYKHLHTQHRDLMPFNNEEFTCVVCDFRTNNKKNLLVHMRKHNAQDQSPPSHVYSCVLCRYMNPRRRNLFQHMKKKHHIEIVMKDDGTASCSVAENSNVREGGEAGLMNVNDMVNATSQNAEIEIISENNGSLNLQNVISLEDIAMVVSNPLTNAVNTDPMVVNVTSGNSSVTSVAEHEAAEAIEGLQALAEQAGLVETIVDNVIEEPVHDMTTMAEDNQLFIDEGDASHHQMIKTEQMTETLGQSIQLSQEQLLNLSSGDYVEINGEMYKVEISSEDKNSVKEEMSLTE